MEPLAACDTRYRLAREALSATAEDDRRVGLPIGLTDLLERSERLYERVMHLDRRMYVDAGDREQPHPVLSQMEKLKAAFGR
jgi:regulator of CtrA degradation